MKNLFFVAIIGSFLVSASHSVYAWPVPWPIIIKPNPIAIDPEPVPIAEDPDATCEALKKRHKEIEELLLTLDCFDKDRHECRSLERELLEITERLEMGDCKSEPVVV